MKFRFMDSLGVPYISNDVVNKWAKSVNSALKDDTEITFNLNDYKYCRAYKVNPVMEYNPCTSVRRPLGMVDDICRAYSIVKNKNYEIKNS